jgi:hypothetical protein
MGAAVKRSCPKSWKVEGPFNWQKHLAGRYAFNSKNVKLPIQMGAFLLLRCGQCQPILNQAIIMEVARTSDLFGALQCKEP